MPKSIFVRVDDALNEAIERCAQDENRTTSALVRHVLIEYLRLHGYIEPAPAAEPKPERRRSRKGGSE